MCYRKLKKTTQSEGLQYCLSSLDIAAYYFQNLTFSLKDSVV